MLIGYSQPAITGAVGITGASWLTADGGAALFDGRPARRARLSWGAGTPTIGQYVDIAASFAAATPLRVLALLGTTLPEGVRVDFLGAGNDGLGGTTMDCRTVRMPDGTTGVWAVAREDDPPETGGIIRIYNDADGATWAASGTVVDLGEAVMMRGLSVPIDVGYRLETVDPTEVGTTRGGQVNAAVRSAYRQLSCTFSMQPSGAAGVREGGLANGMDWGKLEAVLRGKARCAALPLVATRERVNSTALYGICEEIGATEHVRGQFFRKPMVFREIPAR